MQNNFLKPITLIYYALLAGQIMFMAVAYLLNSNQISPTKHEMYDMFIIIVPIIIGSGLFLSNFIFKMLIGKIEQKTSIENKLMTYRSALIIKYALMEGPSLFAIVAFLISGNAIFLAFAAVMILAFILQRPNRDKIAQDLNLNGKEADML
jgi:hypothetical protein